MEYAFKKESMSDYELSELLLSPVLSHLIEYHVELLLKEDLILFPGNQEIVETACAIEKGIPNICLHIKKNENIPLTLLSDGYISDLFIRRVVVKFANFTGEERKISCGVEVAYIIATVTSFN